MIWSIHLTIRCKNKKQQHDSEEKVLNINAQQS